MLISEKLSLSIIAASESGNTLLNLGEIYPSAISAGASGIWSNGVDQNGDALIVAPLMRITNMRIALLCCPNCKKEGDHSAMSRNCPEYLSRINVNYG